MGRLQIFFLNHDFMEPFRFCFKDGINRKQRPNNALDRVYWMTSGSPPAKELNMRDIYLVLLQGHPLRPGPAGPSGVSTSGSK